MAWNPCHFVQSIMFLILSRAKYCVTVGSVNFHSDYAPMDWKATSLLMKPNRYFYTNTLCIRHYTNAYCIYIPKDMIWTTSRENHLSGFSTMWRLISYFNGYAIFFKFMRYTCIIDMCSCTFGSHQNKIHSPYTIFLTIESLSPHRMSVVIWTISLGYCLDKILACNIHRKPVIHAGSRSILWGRRYWRRKEPGHQPQWYWICWHGIVRSPHVKVCSNYICHFSTSSLWSF